MKLITKEVEKITPNLYETENVPTLERKITAKFFTPDSGWTWYMTKYDPVRRLAFGLVVGMETEWGYFSLDELESVTGPFGLPVERDIHFGTKLVSEV